MSLRFLLDKGIAVIPSAHTVDYMIENLDVHTTAVRLRSEQGLCCKYRICFSRHHVISDSICCAPLCIWTGRQALAIDPRGARNSVENLNNLPWRQLARLAKVLG